ncbi:MAG: hypothetical protein KatS3mg011_0085 [Acidimicrobiia bacterium]|nr:MAG: hypothetical protein KatS3mg011_0085 [Acidimicrobiia bacterium]
MVMRLLMVSSVDRVLHHIAPLGLAAAAGTAVVVDLDPEGPPYPGGTTVASLLSDGVGRDHLFPARDGVAVLSSGGADLEAAAGLLAALGERWPAVVARTPGRPRGWTHLWVVPLLPSPIRVSAEPPVVYQACRRGVRGPSDGITLPAIDRGKIETLLGGRVDRRWRWVAAWRRVWEAA